jgi:hypothetical protein
MTHQIKFSVTRPAGDRIHYLTEEDGIDFSFQLSLKNPF